MIEWMNKMNQVFVGGEKNAIFANRFNEKQKNNLKWGTT